jgi:hypothetical protein
LRGAFSLRTDPEYGCKRAVVQLWMESREPAISGNTAC